MKIKKASYHESKSISLRRFENAKIIIGFEAEINDEDNPTGAIKYIKNLVRGELTQAVKEVKEQNTGD